MPRAPLLCRVSGGTRKGSVCVCVCVHMYVCVHVHTCVRDRRVHPALQQLPSTALGLGKATFGLFQLQGNTWAFQESVANPSSGHT